MTGTDHHAAAAAYAEAHGLLAWLGVDVETIEDGRAVLSVPYRSRVTSPSPDDDGYVDEGVISMLIDAASEVALRTLVEHPADEFMATTNLDVTYVRPVTDDVYAEAEVVRAGSSVGVIETSVYDGCPDEGRHKVATGTATYRLFRS